MDKPNEEMLAGMIIEAARALKDAIGPTEVRNLEIARRWSRVEELLAVWDGRHLPEPDPSDSKVPA